jgi:hypothetical protein
VKHEGLRGSFWPTATQEALLRITLGPSDEAAERWRELQPIDMQALDPGSFCLLPLLYERLSEISPADSRLPLLRGVCRSNWLRNQLLIERAAVLISALREREIEPVVIGGPAITARWYSGLGSRPLPQFELAVDPSEGAAAADTLAAGGWRTWSLDGVHRWFVDGDGRKLVLHEGMPPLVAGPLGRAGALRELRARAAYHVVLGAPMLMLRPVDELMIACGLGARTTVPPTIQWLVDAAKMLAAPDRPDCDELLARARRFHLVEPVRDTLSYLAQLTSAELAVHLAAVSAETAPRRESLAYRLSGMRTGALDGLPQVLASGLRATCEMPVRRALPRLPRHVQEVWGATSLHQAAALGVRKILRRVRRRWPPRDARRQAVSAAAVGRNRSASS